MKCLVACTLLTAAMPAAQAAELLCTGSSFGNGMTIENTIVVRLDTTSLNLSANTLNGWAEGVVRADPDLYLGHIYTQAGVKYWINLHRYTGDFYMGLADANDKGIGKPEFNGTCKRTERKF